MWFRFGLAQRGLLLDEDLTLPLHVGLARLLVADDRLHLLADLLQLPIQALGDRLYQWAFTPSAIAASTDYIGSRRSKHWHSWRPLESCRPVITRSIT